MVELVFLFLNMKCFYPFYNYYEIFIAFFIHFAYTITNNKNDGNVKLVFHLSLLIISHSF